MVAVPCAVSPQRHWQGQCHPEPEGQTLHCPFLWQTILGPASCASCAVQSLVPVLNEGAERWGTPHLVLSGPGAETRQFLLLFEAGSRQAPQGSRRGAFPVPSPAVHGLTVPLESVLQWAQCPGPWHSDTRHVCLPGDPWGQQLQTLWQSSGTRRDEGTSQMRAQILH